MKARKRKEEENENEEKNIRKTRKKKIYSGK